MWANIIAVVAKSATSILEPILVTMLSKDVGESIAIKYSRKSGLYGKLTEGRIVTERVSRREHSSWNAVGVRRADVGDIRITEASRTSVEILGALWGPGKEGRVGLERPRCIDDDDSNKLINSQKHSDTRRDHTQTTT